MKVTSHAPGTYVVIDRPSYGQKALCRLDRIDETGQRIRWPSGGWCYLSDDETVIKVYEVKDFDEAEKIFLTDFPPQPSETMGRIGWLAPSGDFFPCAYTEHIALAEKLVVGILKAELGPTGYDDERRLEDAGWIKVNWNGYYPLAMMSDDAAPTRKQMNRLHEVTPLFKEERHRNIWRRRLEDLEERVK